MNLKDMLDAEDRRRQQGPWLPASCGTEIPILYRTGRRLLYVWQPTTGNHAYLDCDTDLILSPEEAMQAMGMHYR